MTSRPAQSRVWAVGRGAADGGGDARAGIRRMQLDVARGRRRGPADPDATADEPVATRTASGGVTVAFAGDVHFEAQVSELLARPRGALGPIARTLRSADVAMLNLETPITRRGCATPRSWRRTATASISGRRRAPSTCSPTPGSTW